MRIQFKKHDERDTRVAAIMGERRGRGRKKHIQWKRYKMMRMQDSRSSSDSAQGRVPSTWRVATNEATENGPTDVAKNAAAQPDPLPIGHYINTLNGNEIPPKHPALSTQYPIPTPSTQLTLFLFPTSSMKSYFPTSRRSRNFRLGVVSCEYVVCVLPQEYVGKESKLAIG